MTVDKIEFACPHYNLAMTDHNKFKCVVSYIVFANYTMYMIHLCSALFVTFAYILRICVNAVFFFNLCHFLFQVKNATQLKIARVRNRTYICEMQMKTAVLETSYVSN